MRTFFFKLAENLESSYRVARYINGHEHKRAVNRYNERVVESAYQPGCLVCVLQHARNRKVPSKLDTHYFFLCKMLEVRGALLILRELETQRVFTANHDPVRRSTMTRTAAPQVPAARATPFPQYRVPRLYLFSKRRLAEPRRIPTQRCTHRPLQLLHQRFRQQRIHEFPLK